MDAIDRSAAYSLGQLVSVSYMGKTYEGPVGEIIPGRGRRRVFYKVDLGGLGKPAYAEHEIGAPS